MPEIGECYSISDKLPAGGKIQSVSFSEKALKYIFKGNIKISILKGGVLNKPFSYGKSVLFPIELKNKKYILCSQLGMTGSWFLNDFYKERGSDHVLIKTEKFLYRYSDPRMFGKIKIYQGDDFNKILQDIIKDKKWGIDPIQSSEDEIYQSLLNLKKTSSLIKVKLLEQNLIFGIGNYLASEILFYSKISPKRKCSSLSEKEFKTIAKNIKKISLLAKEKKGFSFAGGYILPDGSLGNMMEFIQIYGKQTCPNCKSKVNSEHILSRATYFCKSCQK